MRRQADSWARQVPLRPAEDLVFTLVVTDCLAWENQAVWSGGFARLVDVFPFNLTVHDSLFVDNFARVSSAISMAWYSTQFDTNDDDEPITGHQGQSYVNYRRIEVTGVHPLREDTYEQSPFGFVGFGGHWNVGPGTARPDVKLIS
eukprot:SAG31_NODE_20412_length_575_cov_1.088235_2_plen_145_part_01